MEIITKELEIGEPQGLLFWTLAPEIDKVTSDLQYVTGSLIRKFDGTLPGQVTEPDVAILATAEIAVIECKLSQPNRAPTHLWEGGVDSVRKRRGMYEKEPTGLIKEGTSDEEMALVYQLVRTAFYAKKLAASFAVEPLVVSLANGENWSKKMRKLGKSPAELWEIFCAKVLHFLLRQKRP